jgi:hypothetical protein
MTQYTIMQLGIKRFCFLNNTYTDEKFSITIIHPNIIILKLSNFELFQLKYV